MKTLILINPQATPPVDEVQWDGQLKSLQEIVGGLIEPHRLYSGDVLLVDEEWNCKSNSNRFAGGFSINGDIAPLDGNGQAGQWHFGGRGVIVGTDRKGNFVAPKINILSASRLITIKKKQGKGNSK